MDLHLIDLQRPQTIPAEWESREAFQPLWHRIRYRTYSAKLLGAGALTACAIVLGYYGFQEPKEPFTFNMGAYFYASGATGLWIMLWKEAPTSMTIRQWYNAFTFDEEEMVHQVAHFIQDQPDLEIARYAFLRVRRQNEPYHMEVRRQVFAPPPVHHLPIDGPVQEFEGEIKRVLPIGLNEDPLFAQVTNNVRSTPLGLGPKVAVSLVTLGLYWGLVRSLWKEDRWDNRILWTIAASIFTGIWFEVFSSESGLITFTDRDILYVIAQRAPFRDHSYRWTWTKLVGPQGAERTHRWTYNSAIQFVQH